MPSAKLSKNRLVIHKKLLEKYAVVMLHVFLIVPYHAKKDIKSYFNFAIAGLIMIRDTNPTLLDT